jgi:hypothetical protein
MRSLVVVALLGVPCWLAAPARAQSAEQGAAALNWNRLPGAEACPNVGELARRVGVQLKRDAFVSPAKATVLVDVSIQPARPGFRVRILLSSHDQLPPGERELASSSSDCNDAVDAAALAIALMLDPEALARSQESGPSRGTFPSPPVAPPPTSVPESSTSSPPVAAPPAAAAAASQTSPTPMAPARPPRRGRTQVAASALAAVNQGPGSALGLGGWLRLTNEARSSSVELDVVYLAPKEVEIRSRAGGRLSLLGAGLSHVWSPFHRGPWALSLLTGAQVARMFASGFGFTASNRNVGSWQVSGTLEGEAALAMSERWDLALRLGLGVPVWRDTFEATTAAGTSPILEPAPLFGTLRLALAFSP